jgi:hypothetical protein
MMPGVPAARQRRAGCRKKEICASEQIMYIMPCRPRVARDDGL